MIGLLLGILMIACIGWVAFWFLGLMGLPEPIRQVAAVIIGVILLVALLTGNFPAELRGRGW